MSKTCLTCFFWTPEPADLLVSIVAYCLVAERDTGRGESCGEWREKVRVDPASGKKMDA